MKIELRLDSETCLALFLSGLITLPLLIVGFVALVSSGAKMGDIHREAQAEMKARQDELTRR